MLALYLDLSGLEGLDLGILLLYGQTSRGNAGKELMHHDVQSKTGIGSLEFRGEPLEQSQALDLLVQRACTSVEFKLVS